MSRGRYSGEREVLRKSDRQIERETAVKWARLAVACYQKYAATNEVRWLLRAEGYHHEALEHGALVHDGGKLVGVLDRRIGKYAPRRRGGKAA